MNIKSTLFFLMSTISLFSQATIQNHTVELPFVIAICAYNNAPWVEKNLDSIFMQQYSNFRVIYVDDASSDGTADEVQQYIDTHQLQNRITLFANSTRCRKTKNMYNYFSTCADEEIIIEIDGDDWLAHDQVFAHINNIYQKEGVWFTYGQFIGHDNTTTGACKSVPSDVIANRSFRSWKWVYTGLRTFYGWLFKSIKLEDFINEQVPGFEAKFFPLSSDVLCCFSMLEICGDKFAFIPEIHYIYNRGNPLYTHTVEGNLYAPANKDIRSRSKYPQAYTPIIGKMQRYEHAQADLVILSKDNPGGVKILLDSLSGTITAVDTTYILYEQTDTQDTSYQLLQDTYRSVQFVPTINTSVSEALINLLQHSKQGHIVIAKDTAVVQQPLNIHECIIELEKSQAYGFYLGFAHNAWPFYSTEAKGSRLPHEHIHDAIYAWKFQCAPQGLCNNFTMTLHRKYTALERIAHLSNGTTIDSFIDSWQKVHHANMHSIGLFFEDMRLGRTQVIPHLN